MKAENMGIREAGPLTLPFDKTTGLPLLAKLLFVGPAGETCESPGPEWPGVGYTLTADDLSIPVELIMESMISALPEFLATKLREEIAEHGSIADAMVAVGLDAPDEKLDAPWLLPEPILLSMS